MCNQYTTFYTPPRLNLFQVLNQLSNRPQIFFIIQ